MKNITLKVNDNLSIILRNVREVFGHDDSLPYNALVVVDEPKSKIFTFIGRVWNDGWGGPSCIEPATEAGRQKMEEIDKYLTDTFSYKYKFDGDDREFTMTTDLEFVLDEMAWFAIDCGKSSLTMEELLKD